MQTLFHILADLFSLLSLLSIVIAGFLTIIYVALGWSALLAKDFVAEQVKNRKVIMRTIWYWGAAIIGAVVFYAGTLVMPLAEHAFLK